MVERDNELKGTTFTISVLHLSDGNPARIRQLLEAKVAQAPSFLIVPPSSSMWNASRRSPISNSSGAGRVGRLRAGRDHGARDEAMKTAAKAAGLAVMVSGKSRKAEPEPTPAPEPQWRPHRFPVPAPVEASKVHVGPVRSGQQIYAAGTSLVVLGSVSPGAEVIADDSIHVYGALRGRAIAGAKGNPKARIYCQQLQAELLSIAGTFQLSDALPAGDTRAGPYPARQ
jgi:septum site-determining protein MinC